MMDAIGRNRSTAAAGTRDTASPRRPPSSRLHARCPLRRSHACAPVEDAAAARRVCAQAIDALRMTHRSRRCRRVLLCPRARSRALAGGGAPSSAGCPLGDRVRDACARAGQGSQCRHHCAPLHARPRSPSVEIWRSCSAGRGSCWRHACEHPRSPARERTANAPAHVQAQGERFCLHALTHRTSGCHQQAL